MQVDSDDTDAFSFGVVDSERRDVSRVLRIPALASASEIMAPASSVSDIHEGWAVEVIGGIICQVGIGISFVLGEVNVFMAEGAGNHENNK